MDKVFISPAGTCDPFEIERRRYIIRRLFNDERALCQNDVVVQATGIRWVPLGVDPARTVFYKGSP